MTTEIHIRCRDLEKGFRDKAVLRGVTLDVRTGETLVVLGGSGSGKSVLLKHMNALLTPDAGTVEVEGTMLGACSEDQLARVRRNIAMLFQQAAESLMPAELSGGMRKRAALARALVLEPRAVLYDEPTTGLDPVVAAKVNHLIRDLQRRLGLTGVVVTHDLGSAFFVADRIAFLHEGRIRFVGPPAEARASADPYLHEFLTAA